jgi:hypothetical protein
MFLAGIQKHVFFSVKGLLGTSNSEMGLEFMGLSSRDRFMRFKVRVWPGICGTFRQNELIENMAINKIEMLHFNVTLSCS